MRPQRDAAVLLLLLFVLAGEVRSGQSGGLRVHVYDAAKRAPLPGAQVTLHHRTGSVPDITLTTDAKGDAAFPVLPPGAGYGLEVFFPEFGRIRLDNLRVPIGETVDVPVGLTPELTEEVEVVATRGVVDLEQTSTSTKFSDEFMRDLPVQGRLYQNVLKLAPGVQDADGDGNPNVHGARARDFKTLVDGVANVDPLTGKWLSSINSDSIEEIEVITAGAGVEYGRAQGGFANIVQKQGSNDFEGLFGMLYRSSSLDGRGATGLPPERLPDFDWIQPYLQVSGPIVKDRLWFILSHEYQDRDQPIDVLNGIVVTTYKQSIASDRITWQASPRNRLSLAFQSDPLTLGNVGVSSTVPASSSRRIEYGGPTYSLEWTAPYSPRLLVKSVVAYQDIHSNLLPMTSGVPNECVEGFPALATAMCLSAIHNRTSGSYYQSSRDLRQRLTVRSDVDLYAGKLWGMSHQVKFGFSVENERYFRELHREPVASLFAINDRRTFQRVRLVSGRFSVPETGDARANGTTWGVYVEDVLRPATNVSLTLGLRLDQEEIDSLGHAPIDPAAEAARFVARQSSGGVPSQIMRESFTAYEGIANYAEQLARVLEIDPSLVTTLLSASTLQTASWYQRRRADDVHLTNTNLSPFFSASWDPWRNGKTKLAVAFGRHYNNIPLSVPALELEPATAALTFREYREPDTGRWTTNFTREIGGANPSVNVTVVDRNLRTPYQDEWTATIEHELTTATALKLTWVHRRFRDQMQDVDINHAPADYGRCQLQYLSRIPAIVSPPDGILDDCIGRTDLAINTDPPVPGETPPPPTVEVQRPDGYLDSYVLNPGWGGIFLVGNSNSADYNGVVLELTRRLWRGWEMNGSYTWSRAVGNAEDFLSLLGDDRTTLDDEHGLLSYDQTHVLKLNATALIPHGVRLGGTVTWESGLPYSILERTLSTDALPPQYGSFGVPGPRTRLRYPTHERNDQRNEPFWTFNVKLQKEMPLGRSHLSLSVEAFNLLNNGSLTILDSTNGTVSATRRFGRQWQLAMRVAF